jgi:hypothetical protein
VSPSSVTHQLNNKTTYGHFVKLTGWCLGRAIDEKEKMRKGWDPKGIRLAGWRQLVERQVSSSL